MKSKIAAILERADGFAAWLADDEDYALSQALKGQKYEGFKLVAGRSVRKYKDEAAVAQTVEQAGFDPWAKKLLGVTEMTKLLGKDRFKELLRFHHQAGGNQPWLLPVTNEKN